MQFQKIIRALLVPVFIYTSTPVPMNAAPSAGQSFEALAPQTIQPEKIRVILLLRAARKILKALKNQPVDSIRETLLEQLHAQGFVLKYLRVNQTKNSDSIYGFKFEWQGAGYCFGYNALEDKFFTLSNEDFTYLRFRSAFPPGFVQKPLNELLPIAPSISAGAPRIADSNRPLPGEASSKSRSIFSQEVIEGLRSTLKSLIKTKTLPTRWNKKLADLLVLDLEGFPRDGRASREHIRRAKDLLILLRDRQRDLPELIKKFKEMNPQDLFTKSGWVEDRIETTRQEAWSLKVILEPEADEYGFSEPEKTWYEALRNLRTADPKLKKMVKGFLDQYREDVAMDYWHEMNLKYPTYTHAHRVFLVSWKQIEDRIRSRRSAVKADRDYLRAWKAKIGDKLRIRWDGNEAVVAQLQLLATQKNAPQIMDLHGSVFSSLQDAIDSILRAPADPITRLPMEYTLTFMNSTWLLTPRAIVTGAFGVGDPVTVGERDGKIMKISPDGRFVWIDFGQGEIKQFDLRHAKITPKEDAASSMDRDQALQEKDKGLSQITSVATGDFAARVESIRRIIASLGPNYPDMDNMLWVLANDPATKRDRLQKFLGNLELFFLSLRYEKADQKKILRWIDFLAVAASGDRQTMYVIMDLVDEVASLAIPRDRLTILGESTNEIFYKSDVEVDNCLRRVFYCWMEALRNDMSNLPALPMEFDVPLEDLLMQKAMKIRDAIIFLRSIDLVIMNPRNGIMLGQDLMAWLGLLSAKLPLAETVRVMNYLSNLNDNVAARDWLNENMNWLRKTRSKSKALQETRKLLPTGTENFL